ncbi:uncharacterized protein N7473_005141 [Penicillium subrubescens]|uniref:uncharacterized protein n=1 Tax=Penicillium subrubescens TaxID=1316194 RepID=UPI002545A748|nr:uncharacterized protein N7473_005141 [Penicillium subrubescens]KAJ5895742.1 hypothetical protein N7473_005141 [Penicillium subrubescens]
MANPPQRTQQVPQHVTALLSHLTSRPGVQSTLILSRKDGSIIQSTGQLAAQENSPRTTPPVPSTPDQTPTAQPSDSSPASPTSPIPTTYQPSQAEALAAHIFNFVSSASALGVSLARPITTQPTANEHSSSGLDTEYGSYGNGTGTNTPGEEDQDAQGDREEEDEVKLLRMRTRKHEIVVVPDRKYLLCVVHDAAHGGGGPGAAGARSSR